MDRPLLALAVPLFVGCLLGGDGTRISAGLLLSLAVLAVLAGGQASGTWARWSALAAGTLALGSAAVAVERLAYEDAPLRKFLAAEGGEVSSLPLRGRAQREIQERPGHRVLVVDVAQVRDRGLWRPWAGLARISVAGERPSPRLLSGQPIELWATLRLPLAWESPGAASPEAEWRRQGVHVLGTCKSASLIRTLGAPALTPSALASRVREWAREALAESLPPGPELGLVRAMLLGDRTGVDRATSEEFRVAGTYHVLAISGAQVALVAALLLKALRGLGAQRPVTFVVVGTALGLYSVTVGADPPVTRAAVMAVVLLGGQTLDLDADLANLLGLAAALLLLAHPLAAGDLGFQLSFLAMLGLLLLCPRVIEAMPRWPLGAHLALAASVAAQLAILPLACARFHRLAPAALVLNLAALPLASAVLLAGLAVLATFALSASLAPWAGDVAWCAAHALLQSGRLAPPGSAIDVRASDPPLWATGLLAAGLVGWSRGQAAWRVMPCIAVALAGFCFTGPDCDGRLHLLMLDVGQGDALVLTSPDGSRLAVDAGPADPEGLDMAEAVVGPALWSQGVTRLHELMLTHGHPDHTGGARFLLLAFRPRTLLTGPEPRLEPLDRGIVDAARRAGAAWVSVARGTHAPWRGLDLRVLNPPGRPVDRVRNDDSIVVSLEYGRVQLLLTGDVEAEAEKRVDWSRASVLKVPHHGSRSSSSERLLGPVAPRLALLSAGARNRFGHPHAEVVARYRQRGIRVLATAQDGTIDVATDGTRLWTWTSRRGTWEELP